MSVTEQRASIQFCVLTHRALSETLRSLEEEYGKAAMKKTQVYTSKSKSSRKQKFRLDNSKGKVMLEVFLDFQGLVHYEFTPERGTLNK
jgi:hypothetical protein